MITTQRIFTERVFRFGDVVYALECTPKSLRKWMQHPMFELGEADGGWHKFGMPDLCALAVMRKLVDFGVSVEEAQEIAGIHVLRRINTLARFKAPPLDAVAALFAKMRLVVWFEAGELRSELEMKGFKAPAGAYMVVHIDDVVVRAMERAVESFREGRGATA